MEEYTEIRCKEIYSNHTTGFVSAVMYTDDLITFRCLKECVELAVASLERIVAEKGDEVEPITMIKLESYRKIQKDLTGNSIKEFF